MQQAERGQHLKELEDDAHVFAAPGSQLVLAHLVNRLAGDDDLAAGGAVNAGDHVEQRGLAVARRPDDGQKLALLDLEGNPLEDGDFGIADRETL